MNGFMFRGLRVFVSSQALETTTDPVRRHERRAWMSLSYHQRIQKKWIKRWGFTQKPCAFRTQFGLVVHPAIAEQMREIV